MIGLKDITDEDLEVLGILKDLNDFKEGNFNNLDEKVEAFIRGSNEAEYEFDEEEFILCLHNLSEKDYITGSYGDDLTRVEVQGITPAGLKLLAEVEKETEEIATAKEAAIEEVVAAKETAIEEVAAANETALEEIAAAKGKKQKRDINILNNNKIVFGKKVKIYQG